MNEFQNMLPESNDFKIGYVVGKQSTKYWLECEEDLGTMSKYLCSTKSVLLWCDARVHKTDNKRSKRAEDEPPSKRQQIEKELEEISTELKEKHGNKYSIPQLRCWARLLMTGKHQSKDEIPEFLTNQLKKPKPPSLAEAITGAAKTFAEAVKCPSTSASVVIDNGGSRNSNVSHTNVPASLPSCVGIGISPTKITELRLKKMQELRELQSLLEQNILTEEFVEQKRLVLDSLRKLTH